MRKNRRNAANDWRLPGEFGARWWSVFHDSGASFPTNPGVNDCIEYGNFFLKFAYPLPCIDCGRHYVNMMHNTPIGMNLISSLPKGKLHVWMWTVDVHNYVNRRLNKPIVSPLNICSRWGFSEEDVQEAMEHFPWVVDTTK